jgi:hypothetical protein
MFFLIQLHITKNEPNAFFNYYLNCVITNKRPSLFDNDIDDDLGLHLCKS